jgi:lactoylglutathione lyase
MADHQLFLRLVLGHVRQRVSKAWWGVMIEARDLFEVHLTVGDLDEAIDFYRDIVGLRLAHVTSARQAAFFWIGCAGNAMLGLWAAGSAPQSVTLHTAFRVSLADVMAAPDILRTAGVTPLDFDGKPTDLPVVLAWMPAAAVYSRDPAGHLLEYIAMLPHDPRPDGGVVPWRMWELMQNAAADKSSHTPTEQDDRADLLRPNLLPHGTPDADPKPSTD